MPKRKFLGLVSYHSHVWKAYQAIPCSYQEPWLFTSEQAGTWVKKRCSECGRRTTDIVPGYWTVEEINE
jgi:hypothetical protein